MASYLPQSGVGGAISIAGHVLSQDFWSYDSMIKVMEAPSFTGQNWQEHCTGKKKVVYTSSGTWNSAFMPFTNSIKLGAIVPVILTITGGQTATDSDSIVAAVYVSDFADGKCDWSITLVGDYVFGDFSGSAA